MRSLITSFIDVVRSVRNQRAFTRELGPLNSRWRPILYPNSQPVRVLTGPFKGMAYLDEVVWGPIVPRWLGCYEWDVAPVVEKIIRSPYSRILDIGCAEGYYAVGLATRMPDVTLHAFDTSFVARRQVKRLARLNGVQDRIIVHGTCDSGQLNALGGPKALILCDIEGYERILLDPGAAPRLLESDVLVEIHESVLQPSTESLIRGRFAETHDVQVLRFGNRNSWLQENANVLGKRLDCKAIEEALNECRSNGLTWLWMTRQPH